MKTLILLIPILPFLGFLINGLGRKNLPKGVAGIIGSGTVLGSFIISLLLFFRRDEISGHQISKNVRTLSENVFHYFDFINIDSLRVPFSFQIDNLTLIYLLIITGVGFLIHVYSTAYMHEEKREHFARYFSFLNLFVFSMLLLVMGANYVIMFIGWEGVGLCSYLLIGYWFRNTEYNNAAKKAFVMNRIGDLGFLLAIFWMIQYFGSADFAQVF